MEGKRSTTTELCPPEHPAKIRQQLSNSGQLPMYIESRLRKHYCGACQIGASLFLAKAQISFLKISMYSSRKVLHLLFIWQGMEGGGGSRVVLRWSWGATGKSQPCQPFSARAQRCIWILWGCWGLRGCTHHCCIHQTMGFQGLNLCLLHARHTP